MSDSKKQMLDTIRKALSTVPDTEKPDEVEVSRTYRREGTLTHENIVKMFAERTLKLLEKFDI